MKKTYFLTKEHNFAGEIEEIQNIDNSHHLGKHFYTINTDNVLHYVSIRKQERTSPFKGVQKIL